MTTVFQLYNVTKSFGANLALDHVSLSAGRGAVVALLGENGAGKTTALRILLGLLQPDSGVARVMGHDSRRHGQEIRRLIGYVPDKPSVYDWMTVAEMGWFTSGFYPPGYLKKYRDFVRRFKVPERQKLKHLSKGMLAKVSLSLAMAHEPPLLVLDEPTSGLDPMVRREFLESMVDVAAEGRTVLLSSHQIAEVERVADVVAILRQSRIVTVDTLSDLKSSVQEVTITLNDSSVNRLEFPGTVIRTERDDRQIRMLIRDLDESRLGEITSLDCITHFDTRPPSLEEIFVGYMRATESKPKSVEPYEGEVVSAPV